MGARGGHAVLDALVGVALHIELLHQKLQLSCSVLMTDICLAIPPLPLLCANTCRLTTQHGLQNVPWEGAEPVL